MKKVKKDTKLIKNYQKLTNIIKIKCTCRQLTFFFSWSHSSLYFCSCFFHSATCCALSSSAVFSMALLLRNVCISLSHFLTFWALRERERDRQRQRDGDRNREREREIYNRQSIKENNRINNSYTKKNSRIILCTFRHI